MRTFFLIAFLGLLALPAAAANGGIQPLPLTASERFDLSRIEDYLNHLKSISASFMQVDQNGNILRGSIDIQRPGKMRVTYNPPDKDFIIADGDTVHIWNSELQEQTNVDEGSSLAEFILRDPVRLTGDVEVTKFKRSPSRLELTLVQKNDPAAGQLTLIFEDQPLQLRQWRVLDPQGNTTGVALENIREGVAFPARTFEFVPPNFGVNPRSEAP